MRKRAAFAGVLLLACCVVARAATFLPTLPANRWVQVSFDCQGGLRSYASGCPSSRGWVQLAYDSARKKVVLFGGSGEWHFNDMWGFDPVATRWDLIMQDTRLGKVEKDWAVYPKGRDNLQFIYDSEHDVFWMYGGTDGAGFWKFLPKTKTWQRMPGEHDNKALPVAVLDPGFAYAPDLGQILLFGGERYSFYDDTWLFDTRNEKWTRLNASKSPIARAQIENALVYDTHRRQFILFGGRNVNAKPLADTWIFNAKDHTWKDMQPTISPPARDQHVMVYDQTNKVVIMWGGGALSDTWIYDPVTNTWKELATARGTYEASQARVAGAVYIPELDVTVFRDVKGKVYFLRLKP